MSNSFFPGVLCPRLTPSQDVSSPRSFQRSLTMADGMTAPLGSKRVPVRVPFTCATTILPQAVKPIRIVRRQAFLIAAPPRTLYPAKTPQNPLQLQLPTHDVHN